MSKDDRCGDCRFWIPFDSDSYCGTCRAMPPIMAGQLQDLPADCDPGDGIWPMTRDSQWCGKFEISEWASFRRAEKLRQRTMQFRK